MKTVVQELIEWARLRQRQLTQVNALDSATQYELIIDQCKLVLEKEKQQIKDAFRCGWHDGQITRGLEEFGSSENYYNKAFPRT